MSTDKVVTELRAAIDALVEERDELNEKITLLEETLAKLDGGAPKKGRKKAPAKKATAKKAATAKASAPKKARKKPHWSPEKRQAAKERMQKYWADRKKKEAATKKKTASKKK